MFQKNRVLSVLPEEKFRIGSSRISVKEDFLKNTIRQRLGFLRWIQLVSAVTCFFIVIVTVYVQPMSKINFIMGILVNLGCIVIILGDMIYFYFYGAFPVATLVTIDLIFAISYYSSAVTLILREKIQGFLAGLVTIDVISGTLFFVDITSKIIMFSFLRKSTRVTAVADVGTTAFIGHSSSHKPRKPPRLSTVTAIPRTHGGTFPLGKNLPPFRTEKEYSRESRFLSNPEVYRAEIYENAPRTHSRVVQADIYTEQDSKLSAGGKVDKATGPSTPEYDKRKIPQRTPWTFSSPPLIKRPTKASHQPITSSAIPITYSGTFACNNEVVPVTQETYESPISTPRNITNNSRSRINLRDSRSKSEHNSPRKLREDISLSRISEETTPSLGRSSCRICSASEFYYSQNQLDSHNSRKTSWKTLMPEDPCRDMDQHF